MTFPVYQIRSIAHFSKGSEGVFYSHDVAIKGMWIAKLCKLFSENIESVSSTPWVADGFPV